MQTNLNIFPFIIDKKKIKYFIFALFIIYAVLSLYRNPYPDERRFYLIETAHMASIIADGHWFGNEGVGLHGFIFKLPVALIFLISGPSIFIATLFNIILALSCLLLFYKILHKYFGDTYFSLFGIILLGSTYHFVAQAPAFLREIPVIFSLLLFIYCIIYDKNKLFISLSLLLILDAKEHVFFQIVPGFVLWLLYIHFIKNKSNGFLINTKDFIKSGFIYFTPPIIFLFLMFFTGLIPYNMFDAYILGFIKGGLATVSRGFKNAGSSCVGFDLYYPDNMILKSASTFFDNLLKKPNYFTKFFMPRLMSFVSIPKIIVVPSLITSLLVINRNEDDFRDKLFFFFLFWSYFLTFYLRDSNGRYLFPISPLIFLFYIFYLKNIKLDRTNIIIFILVLFSVIFGLLLEYYYVGVKILFNLILLLLLSILIFFSSSYSSQMLDIDNHLYYNFKSINSRKNKFINLIFHLFLIRENITWLFIITFGFLSFSTVIASSAIMNNGQINYSSKFGYSGDMYVLADEISDSEAVWINDMRDAYILWFYKMHRIPRPDEWKPLQDWVPKKKMLKKYNQMVYYFNFNNMSDFEKQLKDNKISKVILQFSTYPKIKFYRQRDIKHLQSKKFLKQEKVINLKNKTVFIFSVI